MAVGVWIRWVGLSEVCCGVDEWGVDVVGFLAQGWMLA